LELCEKGQMKRDEYLTEKMGLCWHEKKWCGFSALMGMEYAGCKYCGFKDHIPAGLDFPNIDFSTWQQFGQLWEWSIKQDWWGSFLSKFTMGGEMGEELPDYLGRLINPNKFADALYKYLKKGGECDKQSL